MKIIQLALRSLMHFRLYTIVNILGLALSLACVIIISRYTYREVTTDQYNSQSDRTCLTLWEGEGMPDQTIFGPWDPVNDDNYPKILQDPSIEKVSVFLWLYDSFITVKERNHPAGVIVADTNFVDILQLPVVQGNTSGFNKAQGVLISQAYAKKIFGNKNPVGETIIYATGHPLTVSGVIGELPGKSLFRFDLIVPHHLQGFWENTPAMNLILLHPETDIRQFNLRHAAYEPDRWKKGKERFQLMTLPDIYFHPGISTYNNMILQGNKSHIQILSIVSLLLLIIGMFNFINIYTVVLLRRGREFGMKKVFGSNARQLLVQLYAENLFMVTMALLLGWVFVELSSGIMQAGLDIPSASNGLFDGWLSLVVLLFMPLVTIIYPFIRYHFATPASAMRTIANKNSRMPASRAFFLTAQYAITCCLIVVSLFFIKQLNYMLHADPGYKNHDIIEASFKVNNIREITSREEFEASIEKENLFDARIKTAISASPLFRDWEYNQAPYQYKYQEEGGFKFKNLQGGDFRPAIMNSVTENYMNLFEFRLAEGCIWKEGEENDNVHKVILNRKAMQLYGFNNLDSAWLQPESSFAIGGNDAPCKVIGVVEDFRCGHLSKPVQPFVFTYSTWSNLNLAPILASYVPERKQEVIAFLQKLHDETVGGVFHYALIEDEIKSLYKQDQNVATIYTLFALIAILISSLGLFSISLFDIQQRYKEIAIRKVNGATTPMIIKLLLRKYYLLLLIAFAVSIPVSWLAIQQYLENFAYQTTVSWWLFAAALFITGGISLLTLIWQIRKASCCNPAEAIKTE